jgi:lipoic acid synthetase
MAKSTDSSIKVKTGFMVGLGEESEEICQGMRTVADAGIDILTIGQYLRPSLKHAPLVKHYHPSEFQEFKRLGEEMGIPHVESGPLVRSSYHAAEQVDDLLSRIEPSKPFPIIP